MFKGLTVFLQPKMKHAVLPLTILLVAVGVSAALAMFKPKPLKAVSPDTAVPVKTIVTERIDKHFSIRSQGTVAARTRTTLVSEVSGSIVGVSPNFVVGGVFKQHEVLMWLDPADYEVDVQRANAELASTHAQLALEQAKTSQAQREWDQTGKSRERAPILALRKPYMDEALAKVQKAEAELKQAQRKLEKTKIRAPYAGMVSKKSVDMGHYVNAAASLGEMFAIDRAEVRLSITDSDLAILGTSFVTSPKADAGAAAQVTLSSLVEGKSQQWDATIVRSEGVVDPLNRTQFLVAHVDDPYGLLTPKNHARLLMGSFVTAQVQASQSQSVFAIPRNAIYDGPRIAVVDKAQRLQFMPIVIYASDEHFSYISEGVNNEREEGVKEGLEVIVSAMGTPINGMRVKPMGDTQAMNDALPMDDTQPMDDTL